MIEKEELEKILKRVLNENRTIDNKTHDFHHRMYERDLERRKQWRELWMKFKLTLVGSLAIAIIGFIGWIGKLILEHLR